MSQTILLFALALLQQIGAAKQPGVGQILVATEKSRDPDLAHSVILLIPSDPDSPMGLMLNRPRGKSSYFVGGPIAVGIHTLFRGQHSFAKRVLDGVSVAPMEIVPKGMTARVYVGYAGWSTRQLIDEISRGLWQVIPGAAAMVFDPHPETLWQRASRGS